MGAPHSATNSGRNSRAPAQHGRSHARKATAARAAHPNLQPASKDALSWLEDVGADETTSNSLAGSLAGSLKGSHAAPTGTARHANGPGTWSFLEAPSFNVRESYGVTASLRSSLRASGESLEMVSLPGSTRLLPANLPARPISESVDMDAARNFTRSTPAASSSFHSTDRLADSAGSSSAHLVPAAASSITASGSREHALINDNASKKTGAKRLRIMHLVAKLQSLEARASAMHDGPAGEAGGYAAAAAAAAEKAAARLELGAAEAEAEAEAEAKAEADLAQDGGTVGAGAMDAVAFLGNLACDHRGPAFEVASRGEGARPLADDQAAATAASAASAQSLRPTSSLWAPQDSGRAVAGVMTRPPPQQAWSESHPASVETQQSVSSSNVETISFKAMPFLTSDEATEEALASAAEEDFRAALRAIGAEFPVSPSHRNAPPARPAKESPAPRRAAASPAIHAVAEADHIADALISSHFRKTEGSTTVQSVLDADTYKGLAVYGVKSGGLIDMVATAILSQATAAERLAKTDLTAAEAATAAEGGGDGSEDSEDSEDGSLVAPGDLDTTGGQVNGDIADSSLLLGRGATLTQNAVALDWTQYRTQAVALAHAAVRTSGGNDQSSSDGEGPGDFRPEEGDTPRSMPRGHVASERPPERPDRVLSEARPKLMLSPGSLQQQLLAEMHLHESLVSSQLEVRSCLVHTC